MRGLAWLALALATSTLAQISPVPDANDPTSDVLSLPDGSVGRLAVPQATGLVLSMPSGERIDTVVLGDPAAYAVLVDPTATELAIRPLRADARSTLSVATATGAYYFELGQPSGAPVCTRVRLASPVLLPNEAVPTVEGEERPVAETPYRLSGDRALRPLGVVDDGTRTFIEFSEDQALPAVFGVGPTGAEEVVDGHMRNGLYVLDRVWPELVFRMDAKRARAKRRPVR